MLGQVKNSSKPPRLYPMAFLAAVSPPGKSFGVVLFFFLHGEMDELDKISLYIVYRLTADVG